MSVDKVWCGHMSSLTVGIYLEQICWAGGDCMLMFWGTVRLFSESGCAILYSHQQRTWAQFLNILPTLMIFCLFIYHWQDPYGYHCQNPLDSPIRSSSALQTFGVPECQIPVEMHASPVLNKIYIPVNPALSLSCRQDRQRLCRHSSGGLA